MTQRSDVAERPVETLLEQAAEFLYGEDAATRLIDAADRHCAAGRADDEARTLRKALDEVDDEKFDSLLARAQHEYVPPSAIAAVYGTLGEIDTALGWIERSYEEGANSVAYLTVDHWNQPLRVHPRFRSILQRTGQQ